MKIKKLELKQFQLILFNHLSFSYFLTNEPISSDKGLGLQSYIEVDYSVFRKLLDQEKTSIR